MDSTSEMSFSPVFLLLQSDEFPPLGYIPITQNEFQKYENLLKGAYNLTAKQTVYIKQRAIMVDGHQIEIIKRSDEPPDGFRDMKLEEGQLFKKQISTLLTPWSIVAFDYGKIDGSGYGNQIHSSAGNECGEKFIISK